MTQAELKQWQMLVKQFDNGWHLSNSDKRELLQLNYRVMEICHKIHNANMGNNL